jgi:hypothetical protein
MEEFGEDCEMPGMWDNIASVRNPEDFGVEPVPIMQEPSINDSVSSMINFDRFTYILRRMNRTIKRLKAAVEMKTVGTLRSQVQEWA